MQRLGVKAASSRRNIPVLVDLLQQHRQTQAFFAGAGLALLDHTDRISHPQSQLPTPFASRQTPPPLFVWQSRNFASSSSAAIQEETESPVSDSEATSSSTKSKKRGKYRKRRSKKNRVLNEKLANEKQLKKEQSPKRLKQQLEELFEEIAPLVLLNQLDAYISKLENKRTPKGRQKLVDESTKESHQDETGVQQPKNWAQSKILSFLELRPLHARPVQTMVTPAQLNLRGLQSTATVLRFARDKSVVRHDVEKRTKMAWGKGKRYKGPEFELRAEWHHAQTEKNLQREARAFAILLAERLPTKRFVSFIRRLSEYVEGKPRRNITHLSTASFSYLGDHTHLVAPDLARFFYFDPPVEAASEEKTVDEESSNKKKKRGPKPKQERETSIADEDYKSPVFKSKQKWKAAKKSFVTRLLALHAKIHNQADLIVEDAHDLTEDEEALAEKVIATLGKEDKRSQKNQQGEQKRKKHPVHLIYDAVVVHEFQERDKEYPASSDTTVFLDNLPIDITENELIELYSRCGDVESVEIFNQRPDLDPGPLSEWKLRELAQKLRKQGRPKAPHFNSANFSRWTRPRTPVHGMLSFKDEESARAAAIDSLRIFGMIVRGHSVRSVKGKEMTRLYVENLEAQEPNLAAMDIEYKINQLLNPGLFVSMDITSNRVMKKSRYPGSFEIMFPTFEEAFEAFGKLRQDLDLVKDSESSTINWIRTPLDAEKYWTRELGGVV